ncbi:hypothetical protein EDB80DRAFT_556632 [Ilyonectria destructans]|nr:hypothetical protein EDB80DRAFT_556632 [Ilyonectria destructans]
MPDRKTRSRGACATCKRRKRKCDKARPSCLACQRRELPCEGYALKLQWDCGVASRGRLAGYALPILSAGNGHEESPPGSVVSLFDGQVNHSRGSGGARGLQSPQPSTSEGRVSEANPDTDRDADSVLVDEKQGRLFSNCQYCLLFVAWVRGVSGVLLQHGIYSLYATSTDDQFKQNFAQASTESPALVSVCLALELMSEHKDVAEEAHLSFERALHIFGNELGNCDCVINRGTLCAGLVLCTLSIIRSLPWTNQLHCMADLYHLRGDLSLLPPITDPFTDHCLEVMGVMDLPNLVFGRRTPCLGFWRRLRQAKGKWRNDVVGGVETMSGLPRSLLDILARTDDRSAQTELWNWHGQMGEYLQAQLWDVWRYAGIILARRKAGRKPGDHEAYSEDGSPDGLPSTEYLLWRLIASLDALRLGLQQPESSHLLFGNAAFWPYLVARCEFALLRSNQEWTAVLHKLFEMMLCSCKARHIQIAQDLIHEAWERGDEVFDLHETGGPLTSKSRVDLPKKKNQGTLL